ncbi:MAG TPA: amidohydrolase [Thermoanaerobaculia bacterium]|nr:amidohydrolase [Thermoanaerobaculia bacterium]
MTRTVARPALANRPSVADLSPRRRSLPASLGLLSALMLLAGFVPRAGADELSDRLAAAVARHAPGAVELAHRIHQNPELSNREVETAALVAEHLRGLGLTVETGVAHTGVVAVVEGGRPGPRVAVRADMDALPVVEATDLPYRSTKRAELAGREVGVAHACGHDVHVAAALGLASVLVELRDELAGSVQLIFQPAEEGPPAGERGGAELMLAEGVFEPVAPEAIFALHAFPDLEVGEIGWIAGPTYASVDKFVATLSGTQSHGAAPHLGVDPVVMAAQAVLALQTIRSRTLPPTEPSVVTVGMIQGGERFNIIPGSVRLEGTVRTYGAASRETVERRMREILDGIGRGAGGSYELEYVNQAPATVNDPDLARRARPALERAVGAERVVEVVPQMVGEDFAYFADRVPGFYFRLGVCGSGRACPGLHTPGFVADDGAVAVGMRAMGQVVVDYLRGTPAS